MYFSVGGVVFPRDGLVKLNQRRVLSEEFILVVILVLLLAIDTRIRCEQREDFHGSMQLCLTPAQSTRLNWICLFLVRSPYQISV